MVSISIFAVIAAMGSRMFVSILRTNTKSRAAREAKQGGSYVVEMMETTIRNAKKIMTNGDNQLCVENMRKLNLKMPDNGEIEFQCLKTDEPGNTGNIASNSARLTPSNFKTTACRFDCYTEGGFNKVNFTFTLSNIAANPSLEELISQTFSAVVSLRNY